ncbi:hypothetical protein CDN99_07620 [Roseateles aquatilis]|uniref:Uncharacterized protein n=1 Tax=Roseateles aquatilis TaxID=431061 RepID=A0A246JI47_9BURK|nr:hypothetical protein [Roseateles aquatilis]OWQ92200.1 hypothetical protein CDN99_07620 [Roseateles aquatilis]
MGSTTDRKTDGKADRPTPAPRRMLDKAPVSPGSKRSKDSASGSDNDAQLPHERDQSTGADSTGGMGTGAAGQQQREVIGQAHDDLKQGQVDTDLRATPGLDAERRDRLVKNAGNRDRK